MTGSGLMTICRIRLCLVILVTCLSLSSCQSQAEVEHLEHVTPDHKPASYAEAVVQLQRRIADVLAGQMDVNQRTQQLNELGDLIRWLPENAADSDLKKAEWEQVKQISLRLETWHTTLLPEHSDTPRQRQQIEDDLQTLAGLIKTSDRFRSLASQNDPEESTGTSPVPLFIGDDEK
ncbi:MAG TPA: hypothetical protein VNQ76_17860 [Planctomicrobium sp.]|nr:hypothetical protein [Planctomicrobium sp.]